MFEGKWSPEMCTSQLTGVTDDVVRALLMSLA